MKKSLFIVLCALIATLIMVCCSHSNNPEPTEPIVITPDSDTTFQNITTWDTILCPNLKIYQIRWQTTSNGLDTMYVYTFEISTPGEYDVPTPVEYGGETMMAYSPMDRYVLVTNPKYDKSNKMIPYYYFTSTIAGNDVGKIIVRKGNICSASESYATVDENNTCIIRQCTVRITPSENGHDLFECHASVVGRNNKLMYHYIMGFIDYNPLWER